MGYYLGVDGGGSKTYALLTDERGVILGAGRSGNGNHQIDRAVAESSIEEAVTAALKQAGIDRSKVNSAYFGLAGADRPIDYEILHPMIRSLGFPRYEINCDTMIALRAGTPNPYGIVLICGTGTNSMGRNRQGETYQCGGFSYRFGDFGGGGSLSVEAFRSVIRAWDGRGKPTLLTGLLLQSLGYRSVDALFDDYLDHNKEVPLHAAKLLFEAASQGDETACEILRKQGEELGVAAQAIIRRLKMEGDRFDIVLAGSILTRGEGRFIHPYIREAVLAAAPGADLVKLDIEPVIGAVWLAMEAGGSLLYEEAYERLRGVSDFGSIQIN